MTLSIEFIPLFTLSSSIYPSGPWSTHSVPFRHLTLLVSLASSILSIWSNHMNTWIYFNSHNLHLKTHFLQYSVICLSILPCNSIWTYQTAHFQCFQLSLMSKKQCPGSISICKSSYQHNISQCPFHFLIHISGVSHCPQHTTTFPSLHYSYNFPFFTTLPRYLKALTFWLLFSLCTNTICASFKYQYPSLSDLKYALPIFAVSIPLHSVSAIIWNDTSYQMLFCFRTEVIALYLST